MMCADDPGESNVYQQASVKFCEYLNLCLMAQHIFSACILIRLMPNIMPIPDYSCIVNILGNIASIENQAQRPLLLSGNLYIYIKKTIQMFERLKSFERFSDFLLWYLKKWSKSYLLAWQRGHMKAKGEPQTWGLIRGGNTNIRSKLHGNVAISFNDTFTWSIVSEGQGRSWLKGQPGYQND